MVSGSPVAQTGPGGPRVPSIRMAGKAVLTWRGASEMLSALRTFLLGVAAPPGEVVLTVAAPFMPSYAVVAAARVRRAHSALITHDLFPESWW